MKRARPAFLSGEHGMAVIGALLVVMVATVLVTGLIQRQAADVRAMENALARSQGRLLLQAGLDWARMVLRADARLNPTTRPDQLWAIPVEDTRISQAGDDRVAVFSGRMQDEQGKFNLRNLAEHGMVQADAVQALEKLMAVLGEQPSAAPLLARRIALAQVELDPEGKVARAPLMPMPETIDDLAGPDGIEPALVEALRPYVTILPDTTSVNANTASAEVLAAVIPALSVNHARALVNQREAGAYFNNRADFGNRLGSAEIEVQDNQIGVESNWFLVQGAVTYDRSVVATRALVRREGRNNPDIVWTRELH